MSGDFKPTEEQVAATAQFQTGENLKVVAFAGTGKTSTLVCMGQTRRVRGLYLAFNRPIADEAQAKFTRNVMCSTTHSLAYRHIASSRRFDKAKMSTRLGPVQLADLASIPGASYPYGFRLNPVQRSFLALKAIQAFCQSDDDRIEEKHVPRTGRLAALSQEIFSAIRSDIVILSQKVWARMTSAGDPLPCGHDGYLKMFALDRPIIKADFIMTDEAQDTNPVVVGLINNQKCQIVCVGDPHQSIYTWRGAVNALSQLKATRESHLTQSFRFGNEIADLASRVLRTLGERRPVRGNPDIPSILAPVHGRHAVLCRTNSFVMSETIQAMQAGKKVWIIGGAEEPKRLIRDVTVLKAGRHAQSPELLGFTDWKSVVEFATDTDEGEDLRPLVWLVEEFGEEALLAALDRVEKEEWQADIVTGTAHRSKGREFSAVRLASDFDPGDDEDPEPEDEEVRLFYVAVTRAQRVLEVDPAVVRSYLRRERSETDKKAAQTPLQLPPRNARYA